MEQESEDMGKNKVFVIGLSKTGTCSMTEALKILGYNAVHGLPTILLPNDELKPNWEKIDLIDSGADVPAARFYKELEKRYPLAKFILTTRERESWLKSCSIHHLNETPKPLLRNLREYHYKCQKYDREKFYQAYDRHVNDVREYFKDKKEKLLEMDIPAKPSWEMLCNFLNKPIPNENFPHLNKTKSKPSLEDKNENVEIKILGKKIKFDIRRENYTSKWLKKKEKGMHKVPVLKLLSNYLKKDIIFADIGAHIGYYSCFASQFPVKKIYAIEMDGGVIPYLKMNIQLNNPEKIEVIHAAMGKENKLTKYYVGPDPGNNIYNYQKKKNRKVDEVKIQRLDSLFNDKTFPDVIKIDVEGTSQEVLLGMGEFLKRKKPILFIEVHTLDMVNLGSNKERLYSYLNKNGYDIKIIHGFRSPKENVTFCDKDNEYTKKTHFIIATPNEKSKRHYFDFKDHIQYFFQKSINSLFKKDQNSNPKKDYLSICVIAKNEGPYLKEWIEFHKIVGVKHFYVYDNNSIDNTEEVLKPYIENKEVTYTKWPVSPPAQREAYKDCLNNYGHLSKWIAFIDVDEFLFGTKEDDLKKLLKSYEDFGAIGVNWLCFGNSGHIKKPEGLIIENYTRRSNSEKETINNHVKSVVQPENTIEAITPHIFKLSEGLTINENKKEIIPTKENFRGSIAQENLNSKIRINHYCTKSTEECKSKIIRGRVSTQEKRTNQYLDYCNFNEVEDLTIQRFLNQLKRNLKK